MGGIVAKKNVATSIGAVILAGILSACSGPWASGPGEEPPADGRTFETVGELREALEAAGFECPEVMVHNRFKYASASGSCGEIGLGIYANGASLDSELAARKTYTGDTINVGKNWIVGTDAPDQVQEWLGGTIVNEGN